jgi:putative addiction module component (TIGR02574 family)
MTVADISKLSLREKLQVMEAIWEDLRGRIDVIDVPDEHRRILDDRRARVKSGESAVLPWDRVKHSFGQA